MPDQRTPQGEGERLHARQRRRFWALIGALAVIGFIAGMVGSYALIVAEDGGAGSPTALWVGVVGVAAAVLLFIYGSWRFFVSVDEVELADNLWASLIGFYAYAIMLPAWWALAALGAVPGPDQWVIYGTSVGVAFAAYLIRKWRFQSTELGR